MNREAFSDYMRKRSCSEEDIARSITLAERFDAFSSDNHSLSPKEIARAFVDLLVKWKADTYEHLLALSRYGRFSGNTELVIHVLGLLDGREVLENLHQKLARAAGRAICDQVFEGIAVPTLGVASPEKARIMKVVTERLSSALGEDALIDILSGSLRDLPYQWYEAGKAKFEQLQDVSAYLIQDGREFIEELERIRQSNGLFFNQVITDDVIDFVRSQPEIASGVLVGNTLYITKIPYMAKEYLSENDPTMKRYYCCHCPWARESILTGQTVRASFCHCSAGFVKKQWEVIFDRPLQAEVLESALNGDMRCRFAIHLPAPNQKPGLTQTM